MTFSRIAYLLSSRMLALLAITALQSGFDAGAVVWTGTLPVPQASGNSTSQRDAEEQEAPPRLRLGDPARSRDRDATIPLLFTPRPNDPIGTIQAEVALPSGPWRFQRAEAPPRSAWKVSARQRRESDSTATLELNISSGSKPLPEGLIGYLRFRLDGRESPLPSGLTIGKLGTEPPAIEVVAPRPPSGFPGLSNDPSLSPTVTCFIFSH